MQVGERVCIRLTELSIRWSGVLRLGFTSHNPLNIQTLPKYASPHLTPPHLESPHVNPHLT